MFYIFVVNDDNAYMHVLFTKYTTLFVGTVLWGTPAMLKVQATEPETYVYILVANT